MKPNVLKLIFAVALFAAAGSLHAQTQQQWGPEWGENATQEQRHQNVLKFNYFKDAYDAKNYDLALSYLPDLLRDAPKAMVSLYSMAGNIYKVKIQQSRSMPDKNAYIDTLMSIYDARITYFGDHARYGRSYTLIQKAKDYLNFRPTDREGMKAVFNEAIDANSNNLDAEVLNLVNVYFKELTDDYQQEAIDPEEYLAYYDKFSGLLGRATGPAADEARTTFDALFVQSKAGDCETLERIFKGRLAETPDDIDVVIKAFSQLRSLNCNSPFFFEVAEKYYSMEPSSGTAMLLAKAYEANGNTRKGMEFLRKAVDQETDPIAKANLCVEISGMELAANNGRGAAEFARQAMNYNPQNGYAYMFLAQSYALGASSCEEFDRQTVYWLAVDELQKARRIFTSGSDELRTVNELISTFTSSFPSTEELFFRGMKSGNSYDVRCGWVTGRTTVKERP